MMRMINRLMFLSLAWMALACPSTLPAFDAGSGEVGKGLGNLSQGRLEEAESALNKARFQAPDDPRILYDLGIVQYRRRNYGQAAKSLERAIPLAEPSLQADGWHNLGNTRFRMGAWSEAITAYERSLALQEDPLTRFNLEQARKRLEEERQESSQTQEKQDRQPQQGNDGSEKKQGQGNSPKDGKDGKPGQEKGSPQKDQDGKKGGQNQQASQKPGEEPGKQDQAKNQEQAGKPSQPEDGKQNPANSAQKGNSSDTADPGKPGSSTQELGEEQKDRKDVAMQDSQNAPPPPKDVSESAKAMKEKRINPYLVEKVLKELEEREREIQLRYRQDPQRARRDEEMDPFMMDPEQLREFFERRGRARTPQQQDTPDW